MEPTGGLTEREIRDALRRYARQRTATTPGALIDRADRLLALPCFDFLPSDAIEQRARLVPRALAQAVSHFDSLREPELAASARWMFFVAGNSTEPLPKVNRLRAGLAEARGTEPDQVELSEKQERILTDTILERIAHVLADPRFCATFRETALTLGSHLASAPADLVVVGLNPSRYFEISEFESECEYSDSGTIASTWSRRTLIPRATGLTHAPVTTYRVGAEFDEVHDATGDFLPADFAYRDISRDAITYFHRLPSPTITGVPQVLAEKRLVREIRRPTNLFYFISLRPSSVRLDSFKVAVRFAPEHLPGEAFKGYAARDDFPHDPLRMEYVVLDDDYRALYDVPSEARSPGLSYGIWWTW